MAGLDFSHRAAAADFGHRATTHPVGTGEDVARSIPTGLAQGALGFAGQLGDMAHIGQGAYDKVADFARTHGFDMPTSAQLAKISPMGAGDYLSALGGAAAQRMGGDPALGRQAVGAMMPGASMSGPSSQQLTKAATGDRPLYQPQTVPGQFARTVASFAPAAAMPVNAASVVGQVAKRALNAVAPGIASEAAGQVTKGTPYEPFARTAAAIGAGALTTAATQPRPSTKMLAQATAGATDAQITQAQQLMADALEHGVTLTSAEALQQVTGGATGMGRLQRVLEGTRTGEQAFSPVMSARPGAVRQAVLNYADTLAPPTDQPSMIGAQAQGAAGGALNDVRQQINATAQPHYDALPSQEIPPEQYAPLAQNPSYQGALATLRAHPELGAAVAHLPDNNAAVVNEVLKNLNSMAEQARPGVMNPQGNNTLAGLRDQAAGMANQVASDAVPDFRAARDVVAAGRQTQLEPLQRGPLGTISGNPDVATQTRALFPTQPLEGAPAETAQAMNLMGGQDPSVPPNLARQHLVNVLNEATQNLQSGPNQWGGAKYATVLAGNPEQRATLLSGVGAAGGDSDRLSRLIDVLDATGQRQAQGSKTAFNSSDLQNLGAMGTLGHVVDTVADPTGVFDKLGHAWERFQTNRNAQQLSAALLAQPDAASAAMLRARQVAPQDLGVIPSLEYMLLGRPQGATGAP